MVILLVDDDDTYLAVMKRALEHHGHRVVAVSHGSQALQRLAEVRPDVVVSDLEMPRMDGIALARRLHDLQPSLPVVLMTATGGAKQASAAFEVGVSGYLVKPPRLESLLEGLRRFDAPPRTRRPPTPG